MRYSIITLFLILILSCDKQDDFESSGTILGVDFSMQMCAGGLFIDVDNQEDEFRVYSYPDNLNVIEMEFPMTLKFNGEIDRECGGIKHINITDFELIN